MFHNLEYWILRFFCFLFKGDFAGNQLQDEIAKEKQVFDLKHQHVKPAACLEAEGKIFQN